MSKFYRYTRKEVEQARPFLALYRMFLFTISLISAFHGRMDFACFIAASLSLERMWEWLDPPEIIEDEATEAQKK